MPDIFLRAVPEAGKTSSDVVLRDPTLADAGGVVTTSLTPNAGTLALTGIAPTVQAFGTLRQAASEDSTGDEICAFALPVVAGNLLIAHWDATVGDVVGVADSQGNIWNIARRHDDVTNGYSIVMGYAIVAASGPCTVTVFSTGGNSYIQIAEYVGPFAAAPLGPVNSGDGGAGSANLSSGNITPAVDGALLIGAGYAANAMAVAGGWQVDDTEVGFGDFQHLTHLVETTAIADAAEWTQTSGYWAAIAAVFLPPTTGVVTTSLTPAVGALALTGIQGATRQLTFLAPLVGALTLTPVQGTVRLLNFLTPAVGALDLTGIQGSTRQLTFLAPAVGALVLAGVQGAAREEARLTPVVGTLTLTGLTPVAREQRYLTPATGALVLTGAAPAVATGSLRTPTVGALTLVPISSALLQEAIRGPPVAALTLVGAAPVVVAQSRLSPVAGALTATGLTPSAPQTILLTPRTP